MDTRQPVIVGLFGPQRCGKNTVVNHFKHSYSFIHHSISDPIKAMSHEMAAKVWEDNEKDTPTPDLNGHTPRDLYIEIGKLERFFPDIWVRQVFTDIMLYPNHNHVIESIGNQRQWYHLSRLLAGRRLVLVEVTRPGFEWKDSRSPIRDFDPSWIINNDRDVGTLQHKVDRLIPLLSTTPPRPSVIDMFLSKDTGLPFRAGNQFTI